MNSLTVVSFARETLQVVLQGMVACGKATNYDCITRFVDHHTCSVLHRCVNIESEIVTPGEISKICPILRTDDVVGALYVANDASACDPSDVCRAMSTQAKLNGKLPGAIHYTAFSTEP